MHLTIANKCYSSWSMRPWLVLRAFGFQFEETVIPLKQPDTAERIRAFSPTGKVPVLTDGEVKVWESLAIIQYLADTHPEKSIWPAGRVAHAHALAISMEMHAGFQALRQACPMNLGKRFKTPALSDDAKANIERIEDVWRETRARFAHGGPYLFGEFTAADAMYAPIATRLDTYSIPVAADTRDYIEAVLSHPAFVAWRAAALAEPWVVSAYEDGHDMIEDLRAGRG